MKWFCILFPAFISLNIAIKRKPDTMSLMQNISTYGVYAFFVNIFSMLVLKYIFNMSDLTIEPFDSFSFSINYCFISLAFAVILPYAVETISKYIHFTIGIQTTDEGEK